LSKRNLQIIFLPVFKYSPNFITFCRSSITYIYAGRHDNHSRLSWIFQQFWQNVLKAH
jgi:hypothetical protein